MLGYVFIVKSQRQDIPRLHKGRVKYNSASFYLENLLNTQKTEDCLR